MNLKYILTVSLKIYVSIIVTGSSALVGAVFSSLEKFIVRKLIFPYQSFLCPLEATINEIVPLIERSTETMIKVVLGFSGISMATR